MLYVKSESGEMVPITTGGVFAKCPTCGAVHQVDLIGIMGQHIGNIEGYSAYCEACSKRHLPMFENADKLQSIADRFSSYDCTAKWWLGCAERWRGPSSL